LILEYWNTEINSYLDNDLNSYGDFDYDFNREFLTDQTINPPVSITYLELEDQFYNLATYGPTTLNEIQLGLLRIVKNGQKY
jgi:hypothetical protein